VEEMKKVILTVVITLACLFGYAMIFVGLSNHDALTASTGASLEDEIDYNKAKYGSDDFTDRYGTGYIKKLYTLDISKYEESDDKPTIYLFVQNWCGACIGAVDFMGEIANDYGQYFNVKIYNVEDSIENWDLSNKIRKEFNVKVAYNPALIIGDHYYDSFMDSDTQEKIKQDIVDYANSENRYDVLKHLPFVMTMNELQLKQLLAYLDLIIIPLFMVLSVRLMGQVKELQNNNKKSRS
jgi:thiol-disulfide isomerase/thioredoxin